MMDKMQILLKALDGIEITDNEKKTLEWLATWEASTVENLRSLITKAKGQGEMA